MQYYLTRQLDCSYDEAIAKVTAALKEEGFGVLTEIDVQATLKTKLDVDFRPYRILGACNPPLAHKALTAERHIGLMLPCNVVVQEAGAGKAEVAAIDPVAAMGAVQNDALAEIAAQVRAKLARVVDSL